MRPVGDIIDARAPKVMMIGLDAASIDSSSPRCRRCRTCAALSGRGRRNRRIAEWLSARAHNVYHRRRARHGAERFTGTLHAAIMDRVNRRFSGSPGENSGPRQRSLMRTLREKVPPRVQHAVAHLVPAAARDFVVDRAITAGHDWRRTPAFATLASVSGYLQFNLRGRERLGTLDEAGEAFSRYVSWLREAFQSFTIADSREPLVKEITWTRDVFPGARQAMLPDAVVSWTGVPTASAIASSILGTIAADLPTGRSGNHHPEGFTIVMERNGARGVATTPGDILDVKPTVFERLFAQA